MDKAEHPGHQEDEQDGAEADAGAAAVAPAAIAVVATAAAEEQDEKYDEQQHGDFSFLLGVGLFWTGDQQDRSAPDGEAAGDGREGDVARPLRGVRGESDGERLHNLRIGEQTVEEAEDTEGDEQESREIFHVGFRGG
jgi:hypothetical protein